MGRFFTDETLAAFDQMNEATLPDSASVEIEVQIVTGPGTVSTTWQPVAVLPCAVHPASQGNQLRYASGSAQRVALWDVTFAAGAGIDSRHRLTILVGARRNVPSTQKRLYVVGAADPRTNETQYIVTAEERRAA
jgi:hypothetical protein